MRIQVEHVSKAFGTFHALRDVSLDVASGELVALLGPSGSGKTTLLRMIAGLDAPDCGRVQFDGEDTTDRDLRERHVGFVFQHYALFRHMSVFENIAFGLRVRPRRERPPQAVIRDRVLKLLKLVHLDGLADRFPSQLSGGQRQRVALARALAVEPRVLLLDEPFGALDARVRRDLRRWLRRLHDDLGITSVFVTHDQEEALELADRVVIMRQGQIEQIGDPSQVYQQPASAFVYDFLGDVNRLPGVVRDRQLELGARSIRLDDARVADGEVDVLVRPHLLELAPPASPDSLWTAKVHYVNLAGPVVRIELLMPWGGVARSEMAHERFRTFPVMPGELVGMRARRDDMFFDHVPAAVTPPSSAAEGALV